MDFSMLMPFLNNKGGNNNDLMKMLFENMNKQKKPDAPAGASTLESNKPNNNMLNSLMPMLFNSTGNSNPLMPLLFNAMSGSNMNTEHLLKTMLNNNQSSQNQQNQFQQQNSQAQNFQQTAQASSVDTTFPNLSSFDKYKRLN